MDTNRYLEMFFPFRKPDFKKKGKGAAWFIDDDNTMLALTMTFRKEPDAQIMCFLRDYAERYDWLVQVFRDWSFTFLSSFLYYEDYDEMEEETREIYRAGMAAFEGIAPEYHIELRDRSTMVWDFHSLLLAIQMMFSFMLVDETVKPKKRLAFSNRFDRIKSDRSKQKIRYFGITEKEGIVIMPKWLDTAVFYEIYPQSFLDTNADGIGDFQGIIRKLDYIRELGFNALWINPCFDSPFGDAGYDVADYYRVAPRYGTNADLKELFEQAHERGIRVLLDLVPGHTSVEHKWFKESMKPEKNEFTDRYVWTDSVWNSPENMGCLRGISQRDGACGLNFFSCQPALNYGFYEITQPWQQSPEDEGPKATLAAMMDVMAFWLGMGCDGFRVDMAGSLVKNDPECLGTIALWQKVRSFLDKEFPEAVLISEWGEPDKALKGGFHMDFLLHFGPSHYNDLFRCDHPYFSEDGLGDASAFVEKYLETREKVGREGLICIPSGNHDMVRLTKHVTGEQPRLAYTFLLTMPGCPFVYYGDEIGMRYVEGLTSVEGGFMRTGARSPMQWDTTTNAGFSAAPANQLYITMDPAKDRPNVKDQLENPESQYHQIRQLIALRHAHPALENRSDIEFISNGAPKQALAYVRSCEEEKLLVVINPYKEPVMVSFTGTIGESIYYFGGKVSQKNREVTVPAISAGIYKVI